MILEIRTYRLKPGTRDEFVRVLQTEAVPLLARYGITVITSGASLVDEDGYEEAYLIRSFQTIEERAEREDAFYGSADWHNGPRNGVIGPIESYHTIVMDVSEAVAAEIAGTGRGI